MSTGQFAPNSPVPETGLYFCVVCRLSVDLAKQTGVNPFLIAETYAKETGVDPNTLKTIFRGLKEPITRKSFKAFDTFDECPLHKSATGWGLDKREDTSSSTAAPDTTVPVAERGRTDKELEIPSDVKSIAETWLRYYIDGLKKHPNQDNEWAVMNLYDLSLKEPVRVWQAVQHITSIGINDENHCNIVDLIVGGSLLANILYVCDDALWKTVLETAAGSKRLRCQLGGIHKSSLSKKRCNELRRLLTEMGEDRCQIIFRD